MKTLTTAAFLLLSLSARAEAIADPIHYAETASEARASEDSDTHRYFLDICTITEETTSDVKVICTGTLEILVFGGKVAPSTFEYTYDFAKLSDGSYRLLENQ